jgi:NitT/TauT family transport system substrate-binding protein
MKRILSLLSILLIAVLVMTACAPQATEPEVDDQPSEVDEPEEVVEEESEQESEPSDMTVLPEMTKVSILTDWWHSTDYAAMLGADYHGFFTERNLDVEIRQGGPGIRPANDVVTGEVDFANALAENVILAESAGGELVAFFATYQVSPMGLMVHEETGATSFQDIIDKDMTVRIFPGQVFWEVLKCENDIELEEIMYDGVLSTWVTEKNWADQAFATTNPYHVMQEGAKPVHISATELGFRSYATTYFTTRDFAEENPLVVRAFAEALQDGLEAFLEDPEPVVNHVISLNEDFIFEVGLFAADVMRELTQSELTDEHGLGVMEGAVWNDVSSRMYNCGIIDVAVDADQIWTNQYLLP